MADVEQSIKLDLEKIVAEVLAEHFRLLEVRLQERIDARLATVPRIAGIESTSDQPGRFAIAVKLSDGREHVVECSIGAIPPELTLDKDGTFFDDDRPIGSIKPLVAELLDALVKEHADGR
jgi:hypothetical protein